MSMTPTSGTGLDIVMYHYVRPIAGSSWPGVKGRELDELRGQLAWLRANRRIVGMDEVVAAIDAGEDLGEGAALLTFDDGLRDHHAHVLPLLVDAGVSAAFYPSSGPLTDGEVLDVHRIQFILATGADPVELAARIDAHVRDRELGDVDGFRARYAQPSRWDPAERVYVKRMLQRGLPDTERRALTGELFAAFVTADEAAFVAELYCSRDELRELRDAGMHLGSHTRTHRWLSALEAEEQRAELVHCRTLLDELGVDTSGGWTLAYPYGDHDDTTVAIARELGCTAAVTIEVRSARLTDDDPLRLPRLNTNDLPLEP
jgi:peptidoglycan/xylan/chitin deacetylase (PgdA/CDA1 family)